MFGRPTTITSDQGSNFVGQWFHTLSAQMGIFQAFSEAHRPQANGRAEVAGRYIFHIMRKLHASEGNFNWVESLPRVLRMHNDVEGWLGYSPYQILIGRNRPLPGPTLPPPHICEDALQFWNRMQAIDEKVRTMLMGEHAKTFGRINATKREYPVYQAGDKFWFF